MRGQGTLGPAEEIPPCGFGYHAETRCETMARAFDVEMGPDRAFLGFTTDLLTSQGTADWVDDLFWHLRQGEKLLRALQLADDVREPDACNSGDRSARWGVCGDLDMTLTTVYGGQQQQPIQWYRPTKNEGNPGA